MDYIRITDDNIEKEHICCAMSGKQGVIKKEWLKQRFKDRSTCARMWNGFTGSG